MTETTLFASCDVRKRCVLCICSLFDHPQRAQGMEDVKNQLDDIKQENQALEAQVQRKF